MLAFIVAASILCQAEAPVPSNEGRIKGLIALLEYNSKTNVEQNTASSDQYEFVYNWLRKWREQGNFSDLIRYVVKDDVISVSEYKTLKALNEALDKENYMRRIKGQLSALAE